MKRYIKATVAPYLTLWDWIRDYQGDPDSEIKITDIRRYPDDDPEENGDLNYPCSFYSFTHPIHMSYERRMNELSRVGKWYDVMKVTYDPDLDRYYIEVEHND